MDRRLTIEMIANELHLPMSTVRNILTKDLQMKRVAAKIVPRILTEEQKRKRLENSKKMLVMIKDDPNLLKRVITGDESWVYGYDPETKQMSSQWLKSSEMVPKKAKSQKSSVKCMLLLFFDYKGVVHHEWVPKGTTVTSAYYISCLHRLKHAVETKRPELASTGWMLHHDNASSHSAYNVGTHLTINDIGLLSHPPYSPDMAPCDFWLFFRTKKPMKGEYHSSIDEIKENTEKVFKSIPEEEFSKCILENWERRWKRCIYSLGEYFEGDKRKLHGGCPMHTLQDVKETIEDDHRYF